MRIFNTVQITRLNIGNFDEPKRQKIVDIRPRTIFNLVKYFLDIPKLTFMHADRRKDSGIVKLCQGIDYHALLSKEN